jgi:rod shape-determining protein MreC
MESVLSRYKNLITLVVILFAQVLGLAIQVKRNSENESNRLIRIWAVSTVTPFEKAINSVQNGSWNLWHNYFYLRGVRAENRALRQEIEQLRLEQARLSEDAAQARRLQALLAFKEQYIQKTVPAQVIGTSGSEQSRSVFIDKGKHAGIEPNMAVITADGIVGKILTVFPTTSQVLLLNDQSSGAGGVLEKSRLQGIVKGTSSGQVVLEYVMSDEQVQAGDRIVTSGGDGVFPKGLPVGTVAKVSPGHELFLNIQIRPAANLAKLEEVLVVTEIVAREPQVAEGATARAVDVLAQRLPSVPDKPAVDPAAKPASPQGATPATPGSAPGSVRDSAAKPDAKQKTTKPDGEAAPPPRIAETNSAPGIDGVSATSAKAASTRPKASAPSNPLQPKPDASVKPKADAPLVKPKAAPPATPKPAPASGEAQPQ